MVVQFLTGTTKLNQINSITNLLLYNLFFCCYNYTRNTKLNKNNFRNNLLLYEPFYC